MLFSVVLQNFRSYSQQKFDFDAGLTVIVGQNTAGKTNLVESIMLLATGKSFRAEKDLDMISFGKDVGRVQGLVCHPGGSIGISRDSIAALQNDNIKLEVTLAKGEVAGGRFVKKYAVNDVPKSRNNFVGFLPVVLFRPEELEIIIDGPSIRRQFLDDILEQVFSQYRTAKLIYDKALRQRNALLDLVRETGKGNEQQFTYWDKLLVDNGEIITRFREECINYLNSAEKEIFECKVCYDKSVMSYDRLSQYREAEVGAGVTLVGPQRDDFFITMQDDFGKEHNVEHFGSRGQQRLVVLQLKLLQMAYFKSILHKDPLLVLDDIFSELDDRHIKLVLERLGNGQVIMTTTHEEFLKNIGENAKVVKLG